MKVSSKSDNPFQRYWCQKLAEKITKNDVGFYSPPFNKDVTESQTHLGSMKNVWCLSLMIFHSKQFYFHTRKQCRAIKLFPNKYYDKNTYDITATYINRLVSISFRNSGTEHDFLFANNNSYPPTPVLSFPAGQTVTLEPTHENKSCSTCHEDPNEPFDIWSYDCMTNNQL